MYSLHSTVYTMLFVFLRKNFYRFLVQLFAIINLNDVQSICFIRIRHTSVHTFICQLSHAYTNTYTHTHNSWAHKYMLSLLQMVIRIESRSTMSETLLPRDIPFVSVFTTHQNRFMCVLDTNVHNSSPAHTHTHGTHLFSLSLSSPYSFIFRFYSIEHVLSERCTIKSD